MGRFLCLICAFFACSYKTYDRLIPMQNTFHKGLTGFGNLIALPLQKQPRDNDNSVFVDESFNTYSDQWNYLYGIKKYTPSEIEALTRQLSPSGELGDLYRDDEDEQPWEQPPSGRSKKHILARIDFPDSINVVRSNMLYIDKSGISSQAMNALIRLAAFRNPEFYRKQAMRKSTHDESRIISCSDETERYLCLPRGLEDEVGALFSDAGVNATFCDKTSVGREIDVVFDGELRIVHQKRLRSYAAIGYKAKGTPQPLDEVHAIYDNRTFFPVYSADVMAAHNEILIVSPYLSKRRILSSLSYLTAANMIATVVTKPSDNYPEKDRAKITECIELLVKTRHCGKNQRKHSSEICDYRSAYHLVRQHKPSQLW